MAGPKGGPLVAPAGPVPASAWPGGGHLDGNHRREPGQGLTTQTGGSEQGRSGASPASGGSPAGRLGGCHRRKVLGAAGGWWGEAWGGGGGGGWVCDLLGELGWRLPRQEGRPGVCHSGLLLCVMSKSEWAAPCPLGPSAGAVAGGAAGSWGFSESGNTRESTGSWWPGSPLPYRGGSKGRCSPPAPLSSVPAAQGPC